MENYSNSSNFDNCSHFLIKSQKYNCFIKILRSLSITSKRYRRFARRPNPTSINGSDRESFVSCVNLRTTDLSGNLMTFTHAFDCIFGVYNVVIKV